MSSAHTQNKKAFIFETCFIAINPSGPLRMSENYREYIKTLKISDADLYHDLLNMCNSGKPNPNEVDEYQVDYDDLYYNQNTLRSNDVFINAIRTLGLENASEKGHEILLVEIPCILAPYCDIVKNTEKGYGEKIFIYMAEEVKHDFSDEFEKTCLINETLSRDIIEFTSSYARRIQTQNLK